MAHFLFFLLGFTCVGSVLGMIISKNQAYNALFLVLAFASMGGLFGLLNAPFIAVVQIIIYASAGPDNHRGRRPVEIQVLGKPLLEKRFYPLDRCFGIPRPEKWCIRWGDVKLHV